MTALLSQSLVNGMSGVAFNVVNESSRIVLSLAGRVIRNKKLLRRLGLRIGLLLDYLRTMDVPEDGDDNRERINIIEHLARGIVLNMYADDETVKHSTQALQLESEIKEREAYNSSLSPLQSSVAPSTADSIELLEEAEPGPHLFTSAFADFLNMSESKYAGVVFTEVNESYPTDGDIQCRFSVNKTIDPQAGDKIGLYKIGWKNVNEAITCKPCEEALVDPVHPQERRVKISSSEFAAEAAEGEFYQFVYVAANGEICGASTPFRVFRPSEDDFIELQNREAGSDDDGFIVVRSQQALLQERLQQLATHNGLLEYTKKSLEQKVTTLEKEVTSLKLAKSQLESKLDSTLAEVRMVSEKLSLSKRKEVEQEDVIETVDHELVKYRALLKEKEAEFAETQQLLEMIQGKHREVLANMSRAQSEKSDLQCENSMLRNQLEDTKAMLLTHESNKQALTEEFLNSQQKKDRLEDQLLMARASLESLKVSVVKGSQEATEKERLSKTKEVELNEKVEDMKRRLKKAAEEYEERYKYSLRVESKLARLQSKVEKYLTKPRQLVVAEATAIVAAGGDLLEEPVAPQTEVKTFLENELAASQEQQEEITLVTLPCAICKEDILCTVKDLRPMTVHLEEKHDQRVCPVCSQMFDAKMAGIDRYFHMHVENHFDVPRYPATYPSTP